MEKNKYILLEISSKNECFLQTFHSKSLKIINLLNHNHKKKHDGQRSLKCKQQDSFEAKLIDLLWIITF